MTDTIKQALDMAGWPQPSADLDARIMAAVNDTVPVPGLIMQPAMQCALAFGMMACLIAGFIIGPDILQAPPVPNLWSDATLYMIAS